MNPTDRLLAWAQIWLSILFIAATFAVIIIYEFGFAHLTDSQDKSFAGIVNWLTGAALIIVYFWFQRTRAGGIPDATSTITQTVTAPDGTTASIKSPAHLPLPAAPAVTPDPTKPAGAG